jgi:hypothetical protein
LEVVLEHDDTNHKETLIKLPDSAMYEVKKMVKITLNSLKKIKG